MVVGIISRASMIMLIFLDALASLGSAMTITPSLRHSVRHSVRPSHFPPDLTITLPTWPNHSHLILQCWPDPTILTWPSPSHLTLPLDLAIPTWYCPCNLCISIVLNPLKVEDGITKFIKTNQRKLWFISMRPLHRDKDIINSYMHW